MGPPWAVFAADLGWPWAWTWLEDALQPRGGSGGSLPNSPALTGEPRHCGKIESHLFTRREPDLHFSNSWTYNGWAPLVLSLA